MSELVSIIMPSYNTGNYIKESIESVLRQTYPFWELIIVDDCSTDNTDEIVISFLTDARIHYLKNEKNSGAAISRNRALRKAKGKWMAFLDSDDLWFPQKLEKQVHFMRAKNCHFSYTSYLEIDENKKLLGTRITGPSRVNQFGMLLYCWPGCLTVMYDRDFVGLVQIEDIKKNNDYAMWLKICRKADCYFLNEILGQYRKRRNSISRQSIGTMITWHYKLWREAEKKGIFKSFVFTGFNLVFGFLKKIRYVSRNQF